MTQIITEDDLKAARARNPDGLITIWTEEGGLREAEGLRWYQIPGTRYPVSWAALADDGTIFVPARIGGGMEEEYQVFRLSDEDEVSRVNRHGLIYVPSKWLKRRRRRVLYHIKQLEAEVKDYFKI